MASAQEEYSYACTYRGSTLGDTLLPARTFLGWFAMAPIAHAAIQQSERGSSAVSLCSCTTAGLAGGEIIPRFESLSDRLGTSSCFRMDLIEKLE